jgi:hypothetical protein
MNYNSKSPYYKTGMDSSGKYLDIMVTRYVPATANDMLYQIEPKYNMRPDRLAFDLYGNSNLWWVFAERNPNTLKDPVGDFLSGRQIYLPQSNLLNEALS